MGGRSQYEQCSSFGKGQIIKKQLFHQLDGVKSEVYNILMHLYWAIVATWEHGWH